VRASRSPTDKQESKYRWGVAAQDIDLSSCHSLREGDPSERADDDDNQRRRAPDGERDKADKGDSEIPGVLTELVQTGL
jgi:hypothetical protein